MVHYGAYRATDKNQAGRCSPPLAAALLSLIICALQTRLSVTVLRLLEERVAKWPRARNKRSGERLRALDALTESEGEKERKTERNGEGETRREEQWGEKKSERRKLARVTPARREFFRRSVPTARRGRV